MELTSAQRKVLTRLAHDLSPVVYIGKLGCTDEVLAATEKALKDHELIKLRFVEWKQSRDSISQLIAEKTSSTLVRVIGHTALFYRQNVDSEKRKINIPSPNQRGVR